MAQIDLKYVQFYIVDGTGTPNVLEIVVGEGNLTWTEYDQMEYKLTRGKLDIVRRGDQKPMDVSMEFRWDKLKSETSAMVPTIKEALTQTGIASSWISTDADLCNPYAVNLKIVDTPPCATSEIETIVLPLYRTESFAHDPKTGMVTCSGKCNATAPTITHTAQS